VSAPRPRWIALAVALAGALAVAFVFREAALRALGRALVVDELDGPADIIVVSTEADGAGVLEAADLVHSGIATRVAVFADPPDAVDREFVRRGVPYEDSAATSMRQLRSLGVRAVEEIPRAVAGSEAEAELLPGWCAQNHFRAVVVVSTTDHSRRLSRMLRRAMKGRETAIVIRPTRYSGFKPDRWWKTRDGIRTEITELEKLLFDVVAHPFS
jgi:hypothetical protein